jgi:hypothetical protein
VGYHVSYQHDIFVSYKRHPETLEWIKEHFLPLLDLQVGLELGVDPEIYVHEITDQIPAGTAWPAELGEEIGNSKILIALWSGTYVNSVWCMRELCSMMARELETSTKDSLKKYRLVIPVVVHDGDKIPQGLALTQRLDLRACYNTRMRRDSAKAEELSDKIQKHAPGIAGAIAHAPEWKEKWTLEAAQKLFNLYYAPGVSQDILPRFYHP